MTTMTAPNHLLQSDYFLSYQLDLGSTFGRPAALFLQRLHYWMNKPDTGCVHDNKRWIFNTTEEWAAQLGYSARQIERVIHNLKNLGVIIVDKLSPHKYNRTNFYTIDTVKLNHLLQDQSKHTPHLKSELSKAALASTYPDKMSGSTRHEGEIYSTNNTNKEKNKSEQTTEKFYLQKEEGREPLSATHFDKQIKPVYQVKKINEINEKGRDVSISNLPQKSTTAQDMLAIWNKSFEKSKCEMSKELAPLLVAAYKTKFDSDLEEWKSYCHLISTSDYMMGNTFSLSIFWALKFSTIDRLRNGELGVKKIKCTVSKNLEPEVLEHIQNHSESDKCKEIRLSIVKLYGASTYISWFKNSQFVEKDSAILFKAETKFREQYIRTHYGDVFRLVA